MQHHVFTVDTADRSGVLAHLVGGQGRTLAFARTKHQAKRWARSLTASGIRAVDLHGNLSQSARQRNLAAFADGHARVLVATDIAARGIHVDDVTLVVHIDPPAEHKAYLHRSGRTARAGAAGVVVTLATHEQQRDVTQLMRRAAITPTHNRVRIGDQVITDIAGPAAPRSQITTEVAATGATGRGSQRPPTPRGSTHRSSRGPGGGGDRQRAGSGSAAQAVGAGSGVQKRRAGSGSTRPRSATPQTGRTGGGSTTAAPRAPRRAPRRATRPAGASTRTG
jgi:superfamily II DNA/RNA helicase